MITHLQSFIKELQGERLGTEKILGLIPTAKMQWAPHAKSMKMMPLANHIADIPDWISTILTTDCLDVSVTPFEPATISTAAELIEQFNKNVDLALENLANTLEADLEKTWEMKNGEQIWMSSSKLEAVRHAMCQMVHHRAQLGVYLRLLDIPIPGVYGPSADDMAG